MSKVVNQIKIDTYEINQLFFHQEEFLPTDTQYTSYKIKLDVWQPDPAHHKLNFIEYIFVVFDIQQLNKKDDTDFDSEKICGLIQANGYDLWDRQSYIYYNRVLPLQCENLYDEQTNNLLQNMVRNKDNDNLKKVLFFPFRSEKNGYKLDVGPNINGNREIPSNRIDNLQLNLYKIGMQGKIDIFMRVTNKNSENIDKINYSHI
jgi:hypothetical protein